MIYEQFNILNKYKISQYNPSETQALYDEIFVGRVYELLASQLQAKDIVFDVGANIGMATLYLHHKRPGMQFFCFEPIAPVCEVLKANIDNNNINAIIFEAAASDETGKCTFEYYPNNTVMSGLYCNKIEDSLITRQFLKNNNVDDEYIEYFLKEKFIKKTAECDLIKLSDIIDSYKIENIALLKIDVEKSELRVLNGITSEHWNKIKRIFIEVHNINDRLSEILKILEKKGFNICSITQQDNLINTDLFDVMAIKK